MTPKRLGPYRLGDEVEARATTVTYRAIDTSLARPVRLTVLRPTLAADSPAAGALARQASVLADWGGGPVPLVLGLDRGAEGTWMACEDPGGASLQDILARTGRLEPAVAVAIAQELSQGLGRGHQRGLAWLSFGLEDTRVTEAGRVVLLDASASRRLDVPGPGPALEPERLARAQGSLSPEQLLGEPSTARTDVFGLGVLLYSMLAGEPPFETSPRHRNPLPRSLRERSPELPRELDALVFRCLARRPEDRYADGFELARALLDTQLLSGRVPPRERIVQALVAARLVEPPRRPSAATGGTGTTTAVELESHRERRQATSLLLGLGALILLGGATLQALYRRPSSEAFAARPPKPGWIRVLARPWAEVSVDGQVVDTTPMAKPIVLSPGKHFLIFRHPQAPDEERAVEVLSDQGVWVDVSMRVVTRAPEASASPKAPESDSP